MTDLIFFLASLSIQLTIFSSNLYKYFPTAAAFALSLCRVNLSRFHGKPCSQLNGGALPAATTTPGCHLVVALPLSVSPFCNFSYPLHFPLDAPVTHMLASQRIRLQLKMQNEGIGLVQKGGVLSTEY